jgi:hypothetical protein
MVCTYLTHAGQHLNAEEVPYLLGVNEAHRGRCRSLVQVTSLYWSDEVDAGR